MVNKSDKPVVLITGASSGIGDGIARKFAKEGWRIVAVARRQERLEQLKQDLADLTEVEYLVADVTEKDAPQRAVDLALESFGRLDCLVNNAGSGSWAPPGDTTDQMIDDVLNISLKAPFRFAREALRAMQPGASILNIGSVFGLLGGLDGGIYCTAKAGMIGMSQAFAVQYGAKGIRSNVVAPGVVKTDMTAAAWDHPGFQRTNQELTPFDRDGTVDDVANTVFFLASKDGSYINGQTIALDGGWSTTKYVAPEALICERVMPE
ncbi:SDR family oxidoreductase [Ketobacter sp. MCCC 1A13808]|uniref:SDR family NAD(P)-dependent oxidoreductase n=1 Tax=Ketobacter sp. MCCC 1A13808 TaxID=2602738 RepID=UPI000F1D1236|nr:SDR family oxidoreductase [Ketobacter sp. MCCC 1A13808]MVF13504.1 SDR family oxidoreductase [Ketobacter sp. MCCC 1A13808]RLP53389.1 MAG: SDR family oxidoreductase [Ketobacter sp.]